MDLREEGLAEIAVANKKTVEILLHIINQIGGDGSVTTE